MAVVGTSSKSWIHPLVYSLYCVKHMRKSCSQLLHELLGGFRAFSRGHMLLDKELSLTPL